MTTTPFAFTPTTGLRDSTAYPTNPGSEAAARAQVQTGMDQLREYVNGQLQTDLVATYATKAPTLATYIAPTLLNAWVNFGGAFETPGYYKDDLGIVHIKGLIKSGTATPGTGILVLPAGYRPLEQFVIVTVSNDLFGEFQITPSGSLAIIVGSNVSFSLKCSFRAEQ